MSNQETQSFEDKVALVRCLPELNNLRMTGELTDLTVELQDDVSLPVHRVAKPLIDYVYTGQLEVNEANATGLIVLSQQLVMPRVEEWAHIKTTLEATVASDLFIQLPADAVLSILRADDLIVDSEESVVRSIELWVSSTGEVEETRLVHAEAMLREVRWDRVDADFRCRLFNEEGFWNKSVGCLKLLGRINSWIEHPSSKVDGECPFNEKRRRPPGGICFIGYAKTGPRCFIEYDFDANTSKPLAVSSGSSSAAFVAIESCIFAIGGDDNDGSFPNVHKFDTKEHRWKECARLSTGRRCHSVVAVPVGQGNVICVFGGWNNQNECLDTCEIYSAQEDKW
ncbi:hypothetical protein AAHC03_025602 [Spirometra sp. Aus1]